MVMDLRKNLVFVALALLGGCSVKPVQPYAEPPQGAQTAQLRVITNGEVRGADYAGCVGETQGLAKAGRFSEDLQPSINYPQAPLVPGKQGMAPRYAPKMQQYLGAIRMAEGLYTEIVAEYRVPAGTPFLLESMGLAAGSYGSTYLTCPAAKKVVQFEPGRSYEVYVGLNSAPGADGKMAAICVFGVYELLSLGQSQKSLPLPIVATPAVETRCPSR